jgi:mannitol/fructose-specific phosphotransferase system IIA component (Ntr-type)
MNVLDILEENCVALDLEIADKGELVSKLVGLLESAGVVTDREEVVQRVLEREKLMSTGIGGGVAIPHAQCRGASRLAIALARTKAGVEFDALDGKPVRLFFMIIGPEEKGGYVRILARISRLLYTGDLQKSLYRAETPGQAIETLKKEEERLNL